MKEIISEKFKLAGRAGPKMETLKKNKVQLTEEERKEVMERGAVWHYGPDKSAVPAVWKSNVDGKDWYVCDTHRAYQCKPTLKGAINAYDFISTTANLKFLAYKLASKNFVGNCITGLNDEYFRNNVAHDATELAQIVENKIKISKEQFFNMVYIHPEIEKKIIKNPLNYEYYYNPDTGIFWYYDIKNDVEYFYI